MATDFDPATQPTLEAVIAADRERLKNERAAIWDQMKELEDRLAQIDRQMTAIKLYEDALQGKVPIAPAEGKEPRAARTPRGGGRGKREELLQFIKDNFEAGVTRAELLNAMNIDEKDEDGKRQAQSVSNALSNLTKQGRLVREGREYKPA